MHKAKTTSLIALFAVALLTGCANHAHGNGEHNHHADEHAKTHGHTHEHTHGQNEESNLYLNHCTIQESIPGARATGAFLTIHKHGSDSVALTEVKAPSITEAVEIHEMIMQNGVMTMSKMPSYPLKSGDNIFEKGGYHIMLMDLAKPLAAGEQHALQFVFSDGSQGTCNAVVKRVEDIAGSGAHSHKHDHKH